MALFAAALAAGGALIGALGKKSAAKAGAKGSIEAARITGKTAVDIEKEKTRRELELFDKQVEQDDKLINQMKDVQRTARVNAAAVTPPGQFDVFTTDKRGSVGIAILMTAIAIGGLMMSNKG